MSADRKTKRDRKQRTTYSRKPAWASFGEWINTTPTSDTSRAAISFGAAKDKSFTTGGIALAPSEFHGDCAIWLSKVSAYKKETYTTEN